MKKLIVFLRHNNDIDHITPVVYKWLQVMETPVEIYVTSSKKIKQDYRLVYLKNRFKNKIIIKYILDDFYWFSLTSFYLWIHEKNKKRIDRFTKRHRFIKQKIDGYIDNIINNVFNDKDEYVVVFDWIMSYFVERIISYCHKMDYRVLSLPHGDAPYTTQLILLDEIDFSRYNENKIFELFDYVVVPNWNVERRYFSQIGTSKVKRLGSARYCDEWIPVINQLSPSYDPGMNGGNVNFVLLLRNSTYPIFWDEAKRMIKLMYLHFKNINLVIKPHARVNHDNSKYLLFEEGSKLLKYRPNCLQFAFPDTNPVSLIRWSDIVLDFGTTMIWEPIKKYKPVLSLDYLHSNNSTVSHYMDNCSIDSRDKFYYTLKDLIEKGTNGFYDENQRKCFIDNIIDVPDGFVLERYVDFIGSCF